VGGQPVFDFTGGMMPERDVLMAWVGTLGRCFAVGEGWFGSMQFEFIHAADIHLGHEQYNLPRRSDDFAVAYLDMVQYAVQHHVDFVIVAGDLFHHARTDAVTLKQAMAGLNILRDARIPVVAVEGNHDAQHYYKNLSWMRFLCEQGLLILLDLEQAENGLKQMTEFDREECRGSWVEVSGARIYGLKYYGASTARLIEEIAGDVEAGSEGYTIMVLHAGMHGQVPHLHGGLTPGQLGPLFPAVDYIALGHVHKRLIDDPIFNPGSLETNSIEEMEWEHGFFHVRVNSENVPKHTIEPVASPHLREFRRISVVADGNETLGEFVAKVAERVAAAGTIPEGAVIELVLGGTAGFRRQDVPLEALKAAVELRYEPLVVRLRNTLAPPGIAQRSAHQRTSRGELERQTVEQLVYNQAEHRDHVEGWTRLVLDVKNMAAERDLPANIVDRVREVMRRLDGAMSENAGTVTAEMPEAVEISEVAAGVLPVTSASSEFDLTDELGDEW
jgi:DNA repair protein SbcD/Mre11